MDKFLHDENLKLLHKRLTETIDEKQRQVRHSSSPNRPKRACYCSAARTRQRHDEITTLRAILSWIKFVSAKRSNMDLLFSFTCGETR